MSDKDAEDASDMSDIVERLREMATGPVSHRPITAGRLCKEAAAEIERLRAALRDLINIPAVRQVLGERHTADCGCPLCRSRAALSPLPAKKGGTVD